MKTSACTIRCALCGADLPLYVNEGPICPSCLGRRSGQWNYSVAEPWNALSVAINRIRELEDENRCLEMRLEDCRLEAEGVAVYIHEAKRAEDRADRLAVIADALAAELVAHKPQRCNYLDDIERYYDENNGDEEPEQVAQLFDEAETAYQAALRQRRRDK